LLRLPRVERDRPRIDHQLILRERWELVDRTRSRTPSTARQQQI